MAPADLWVPARGAVAVLDTARRVVRPAARPAAGTDPGGLGPDAFRLIDLPAVPSRLLAGFRSLPPTERIADALLYRRTHQVRMAWTADDDWLFTMAGADGFAAHPDEAGRHLRTDVTSLLWRALGGLWLDVFTDWHIDVHQQRLVVPATAKAPVKPPTVSGIDEEAFAMIAVVERRRADGGVTVRRRGHEEGPAGAAPVWNRALRPDQALLLDLRATEFEFWDLAGDGRNPAVQDMLISVIRRHRKL